MTPPTDAWIYPQSSINTIAVQLFSPSSTYKDSYMFAVLPEKLLLIQKLKLFQQFNIRLLGYTPTYVLKKFSN